MDDFDDFGEFSTSPGTNRGAAAGQDGVAVGGEQVDESGHKGEDIVTAMSSTTPSPARRRRRQSEGGIKSPLGRSITSACVRVSIWVCIFANTEKIEPESFCSLFCSWERFRLVCSIATTVVGSL